MGPWDPEPVLDTSKSFSVDFKKEYVAYASNFIDELKERQQGGLSIVRKQFDSKTNVEHEYAMGWWGRGV